MKFTSQFIALFFLTACGPALATSSPGQNTDYPTRAITLVVPWSTGGVTDSIARLAARLLGAELKQPVVVENRPGAAGTIGAGHVAKSKPDGYTLLVGGMANMVVNPTVYKGKLKYEPIAGFTSIYGLMAMPVVIVTRSDSPYRTLDDMLGSAKSAPNTLTYASSGRGSVSHLSGEMLQSLTKTHMIHVPYKGSSPAVTDLLGGSVDFAFDYGMTTGKYIKSGRLTPLAISGSERLAMLPDVPTLGELGFENAEVTSWLALYAPVDTPRTIVDELARTMKHVLTEKEFVEGVQNLGGMALPLDAMSLDAKVVEENKRWKPVMENAGLAPN